MTPFSHARLMSASCSPKRGCGHTQERIELREALTRRPRDVSALAVASPEGLDYVGGGRGPGGVGFPGEGDGGARDVRHLGFKGGAGDQVWIGGSVRLHWDSKLLTATRWRAGKRNELATCTLIKTNVVGGTGVGVGVIFSEIVLM